MSRPLPVDLVEDASEDGKHDDDDDGDDDADDAPKGHRGRVGEVVHGVNSWMTHCGESAKNTFCSTSFFKDCPGQGGNLGSFGLIFSLFRPLVFCDPPYDSTSCRTTI